jgi:hypothetical protein
MSTMILADSSGSAAGGVFLLIFVVGALVAVKMGYGAFKRNGFRPRDIETGLSSGELRQIFVNTVTGTGWSIVDQGNPMVAQSTLLAGIRQQIALHIDESGPRTRARIATVRYSKKVFGGATKAYTLRWRMNAFIGEVQRADVSALVAG